MIYSKGVMKRILITLSLITSALITIFAISFAQVRTAESEAPVLAQSAELSRAYFAGGCFWCVEADFEKHEGVSEVISGYMGGTTENPTYKQVVGGRTGHREAVEVIYDPEVISYQELLDIFWRLHDPTDGAGSFVDRGFSYSSAIYVSTEEESILAEGAKQALDESEKFNKAIATEILPATPFYVAEEYHQDYYIKSERRYGFYRSGSGRDTFINRFWKGDSTVYQLPENL